ncbi:hypothetical protein PFISCL1PPCAC_12575, partial [Pristionchus fissidentatus]
ISEDFEVEAIVGRREKYGYVEYEVKWKGYENPTWEPVENCSSCRKMVDEFNKTNPRKGINDSKNKTPKGDARDGGRARRDASKKQPSDALSTASSDSSVQMLDMPKRRASATAARATTTAKHVAVSARRAHPSTSRGAARSDSANSMRSGNDSDSSTGRPPVGKKTRRSGHFEKEDKEEEDDDASSSRKSRRSGQVTTRRSSSKREASMNSDRSWEKKKKTEEKKGKKSSSTRKESSSDDDEEEQRKMTSQRKTGQENSPVMKKKPPVAKKLDFGESDDTEQSLARSGPVGAARGGRSVAAAAPSLNSVLQAAAAGNAKNSNDDSNLKLFNPEDLRGLKVWSAEAYSEWLDSKRYDTRVALVGDGVEKFLGRDIVAIVGYVPTGTAFCLVQTNPKRGEQAVPIGELVHGVESTLAARLFPKAFSVYTTHLANGHVNMEKLLRFSPHL